MATDLVIEAVTEEEARLLDSTDNDFFNHGKTNVKCPRCGGAIITTQYGTSYTIGCEFNCIEIACRGI